MPDLWPFTPLVAISEKLTWLTDVLQSRALEDAISLRIPRQSFTYRFAFDDQQMARAAGMIRSNPTGDWLLPVWPERTLVSNTVLASDTSIPANTSGDYRIGGQVVLIGDDQSTAVAEIAAINAASLDLTAPVGADISSSAVAPLRSAFAPGGMQIERQHVGLSFVAMEFHVRDNIEVPETPFVQYLGFDVLTDPSLMVEPLSNILLQPTVTVDNGFGPVVVQPTRDHLTARHSATFLDATPEARWTRKKWLYAMNGKQGRAWLPTWADDLLLASPVGAASNSITVAPVLPDPTAYVGRHILIDDGERIYREVTSAIQSGANHRLYLSPLGRDVATARIGFLNLVRLDTDLVEIEHSYGFLARINLPMVEVQP